MTNRAAICIGVNRAASLTGLQAAASGAADFARWAEAQGCATTLLTDDANSKVTVADIFAAVDATVKAKKYAQLVIYFSGHGILTAPGTEYWLLSHAPGNPNESVNLRGSVDDARYCGVPHVIFISDACRTCVQGPPLSHVRGATIFPPPTSWISTAEIDIFYATRAGDPAWELPHDAATGRYEALFTNLLLGAVTTPNEVLVERPADGRPAPAVITSRALKRYLEPIVPARAADYDARLRQMPEVRVETALPKFFAIVDPAAVQRVHWASPADAMRISLDDALDTLTNPARDTVPSRDLPAQVGLDDEVARITGARGRKRFETHMGFTVHGARVTGASTSSNYQAELLVLADDQTDVRGQTDVLVSGNASSGSIVLSFETGNANRTGTILPILPEFIGSVLVDDGGRVISVQYVPSANSRRYRAYLKKAATLERMRATAAVAARHGRFVVEDESPARFAQRIRQEKALDPVLGLYAAYAYAQAGRYADVFSVFEYMRNDSLPIPFDVVMLAARYPGRNVLDHPQLVAPFTPLLSQGWALLEPGNFLHQPVHEELRLHLVPALWTTFTEAGVARVTSVVEGRE